MRRFRWPTATLPLARVEGWWALRAPLVVQTQLGGLRPPLPLPNNTLGGVILSEIRETFGGFLGSLGVFLKNYEFIV